MQISKDYFATKSGWHCGIVQIVTFKVATKRFIVVVIVSKLDVLCSILKAVKSLRTSTQWATNHICGWLDVNDDQISKHHLYCNNDHQPSTNPSFVLQ